MSSLELPKKSNKEVEGTKEMRERVENLKESDDEYNLENPVYDLAKNEGEFREKFSNKVENKILMNQMADYYSDAILENIETEKKGLEDVLTGLRNRNSYIKDLPKFITLAKRENFHSSLLMIDFDHFKKVNDQYGHDAGDTVLKKLSEIIKKNSRESDLVYRMGGEEFAVYLPDTDLVSSEIVAEKIRLAVEESSILIKDNQDEEIELKKTISIGVADIKQIDNWKNIGNSEIIKRLSKMADKAMYNSKENGRNQVSVYQEK